MPGEDIERQLQRLDRSELRRGNWQQLICVREKAAEDLKGDEEDGISELFSKLKGTGKRQRRVESGLFLASFWAKRCWVLKEIRTTGSQF
jgi:hypothetical protein